MTSGSDGPSHSARTETTRPGSDALGAPAGAQAASDTTWADRSVESATDLVAALWRTGPASMWRSTPTATDLRASLDRCVANADRLAGSGPLTAQPAARLLADTGRALLATLGASSHVTDGAPDEASVLPSSAFRRIARMEQWLSARAVTDPTVEPAANLCLWVLEYVEGHSASG